MILLTSRRRRARPGVLFRYLVGEARPGAFTGPAGRTYFDASGTLQTAALNVARAAHYVGGVRTLLLENAATSVCAYAQPTKAQLGAASAGTADAAGVNGFARSIHVPAAVGEYAYVGATLAGSTAYIFGIYVVMDDGSKPRVRGLDATFDLDLRVAGGGVITATRCETVVAPLYRVVGTYTTPGGPPASWGISTTGAAGTKAFSVMGYHAETGTTLSSLILCAGSPTQRTAEALDLSGLTWPSQTTTRHWRYYDLATAAWVENVNTAARTGPDDFTNAAQLNRAYTALRYPQGTRTLAECQRA